MDRSDLSRVGPAQPLLSRSWIAFGAFLVCCSALSPILLLGRAPDPFVLSSGGDAALPAGDDTKHVVSLAKAASEEPTPDDGSTRSIAEGSIVPGERIGGTVLGEEADRAIRQLAQPVRTSYEPIGSGLAKLHHFDLDSASISIRSDPQIGRIAAIEVKVPDCNEILFHQPRQEGLPATRDGLSVGSHISRVEEALGTPEVVVDRAGEGRIEKRYPGMSLEFCAESMLVSRIAVHSINGALPEPTSPAPSPVPAALVADAGALTTPQLNESRVALGSSDADEFLASLQRMAPSALIAQRNPDIPIGLIVRAEPPSGETGAEHALAMLLPDTPDNVSQSFDRSASTGLPDQTPDPAQRMIVSIQPREVAAPEGTEISRFEPPAETGRPALALASTTPRAPEVLDLSALVQGSALTTLALADQPTELSPESVATPAALPGTTEAESLAVAELDMSARTRRGLQRRLSLIGYRTGGVDGVIGPRTRTALRGFQEREGLAVTGVVDTQTLRLIKQRSGRAYAKWASRRAQKQAKPGPVKVARIPAARAVPECARDSQGQIVSNQSFGCDVSALKEGVSTLLDAFGSVGAALERESGGAGAASS